jgi:hypothetical protein
VLDVETARAQPVAEAGPGRRFLRGVATLLLGGLTAMELLAATIVFVAVIGFLWATDRAAPESLVTTGWMRAAWVMAVVAVVRPITWLPYLGIFAGLRGIERAVAPDARSWVRNLVAHIATVASAVVVLALVFLAVPGAERWTLSVLGFSTGTVDVGQLGTATGRWGSSQLAFGIAAVVAIRPVIPPLALDLEPSVLPILGFVEGTRGRLDRWLLWIAVAAGLTAAAIAAMS